MNHSQARTAARRSGVSSPGRLAQDPLGGHRAYALDHLAHLGHAGGAADELGVGVAVVLDPGEEGVELLLRRRRVVGAPAPRARRAPCCSVAAK